MVIEVTSCHDCPFCNSDSEDGNSCRCPKGSVEQEDMPPYNEEWIPYNCPLVFETFILQVNRPINFKP